MDGSRALEQITVWLAAGGRFGPIAHDVRPTQSESPSSPRGAGPGAGTGVDVLVGVVVEPDEDAPGGQLPVDDDDPDEHADFACSSVNGSLSSFELAHLHRREPSEPTQRYACDDLLSLSLEHDLLVPLLPAPELSPPPQAKETREIARRMQERVIMPP